MVWERENYLREMIKGVWTIVGITETAPCLYCIAHDALTWLNGIWETNVHPCLSQFLKTQKQIKRYLRKFWKDEND
jgi:hypothetical protein